MPKFDAQVLGGFGFQKDGGDVKPLHAERLMLFLSYLLVHFDSTPLRKQISFLFWADSAEEQARTNLRNILHHLRKAFPELDSVLDVDNQFIRLRLDADISLDIRSFKLALASAKAAKNDVEKIQCLHEAVSHYRGELLPGFYDDWILAAREECHQAYINALFELSKLYEDSRQYAEAIQAVNRLLRADALNEAAYQQLMRLRALNDDRAGALQVYHACSTVLMRELGVEPSAEIKRLHEQLIRSEEMLEGEGGANQVREANRLIGRKQEWGRLREAWSSIQKGKAGMTVILGEAGIGKSRLAGELMQWVKRQGVLTAFAQCYPMEENLSFAPVVAWLRTPEIQNGLNALEPLWKKEVARLMPEMEMRAGDAGEKKWQKQRLFEAVAKGLLGSGKPRLLALDDAQWSDRETLEFVQYLMRYAAGSPLMLLATARVEELDADHPLQQLRVALQARKQLDELELNPLDKMEVGLLAREATGAELGEAKEEALFAETEGNPFFVLETLRSNEEGNVPQSLKSVLNRRLSQLSGSARDLAGLASAIGREFGHTLLAHSSQMDENALVQALDELWARRIFQTREDGGYAFSHGKLLDAAYESLTLPRRQMFHRRIAEALLQEAEAQAALVARHYEMCGEFQEAFKFYLQAAESARRIFANRDAVSHLEKSLELLSSKLDGRDGELARMAFEAREALGDLYDLGNERKKAAEIYSEALDKAPTLERLTRIRLLGKIARITAYDLDYEKGIQLFDETLALMGEPPNDDDKAWRDAWFKIQFDRIWVHYDFGDVPRTQQALEAARPAVERMGELDKLGEYYFLMPTLYFRRDGYQMNDEIMRYSTLALEIGKQTSNLELRTRTFFGCGFCNFLLGNFDLAIQYFGEGLRLAEQIGYVEQQIYCLTYLVAAHRCAGHVEECESLAGHALALCEREDAKSFASTANANLGWAAWKKGDLKRAKELSRKAAAGWGQYYPFKWYGLWTLIDISLASLKVEEAVGYARQLKAPGQQVFPQEVDCFLAGAIESADMGETAKCRSLLEKAVDWAKENHFL